MKIKKVVSALLAVVMTIGCFAGCGKKNEEEIGEALMPSISTAATGRYVEKEIPLPACRYAEDMVMLSDGRLRVALQEESNNILICTSGSDRRTWEETVSLPSEIMMSGSVESVALSPDGTVFCDTIEDLDDDTHRPHLWVVDPDGSHRELPLDFPDLDAAMGYFIPYADFTEDGRLFAQIYVGDFREIDLTTGEIGENISELDTILHRTGCAGNNAYLLGKHAGYYHDGQTEALPDVLRSQLETELEENFGTTPRITFWENKDGYLFFTTSGGLYSYIPGGSVTEELVSGGRSTLGDPACLPVALTGSDDGSFYVLASVGSTPTLCHFTFDEAAPVAADTQLRIYSLYQDEDLTQIINHFQRANPDISVELEVGLSGEDGITEADAVRTLNTEILAGNGPDIICLDGFDLNTYQEKGLLTDVSGVLAQGAPLLEQITHCYAENGKVFALPTTFAIPVMYGAEHIVSQIHDLDSLVAAAKQARAENPDLERIVNAMHPVMMADIYYDSCSAAWMNPDGTLDAEKLARFYAAMTELYALDEPFRQKNQDWVAQIEAELDDYFVPGEYTGLGGASYIFQDISYLSSGTLDGMTQWSYALAGESEFLGDGYATIAFSGQVSNVFLPRRIMGILTTAEHPQAAEIFLTFMLSDAVQAETLSTGFPVNKVTFDREIREEGVSDSVFGSSDADGNVISYSAQWPDAARREELRGWVDNLTTPANTNRTIRKMVMEPMYDCCTGAITPEQAAEHALQALNLYLSE